MKNFASTEDLTKALDVYKQSVEEYQSPTKKYTAQDMVDFSMAVREILKDVEREEAVLSSMVMLIAYSEEKGIPNEHS